jgi:hypothetical protein
MPSNRVASWTSRPREIRRVELTMHITHRLEPTLSLAGKPSNACAEQRPDYSGYG